MQTLSTALTRMTESMANVKKELVSAFIASTCQLLPKVSVVVSDRIKIPIPSSYPVQRHYGVPCGSKAEFYIRPLLSCINDFDALCSKSYELAFIDDFPVLPYDVRGLSDTIECYKIEPYLKYPGFVRLQILGGMSYNWKRKIYEFHHATSPFNYKMVNLDSMAQEILMHNKMTPKFSRHKVNGPALELQPYSADSTVDMVQSVWCPQWPREAQNWPIRPRNHGWPTTATISEVLQNGCHFVYVQHRDCKDDKEQWRYSFSVAEVTLLQSWTHVQQIVYHTLRFFTKRELIEKDCPKEDEVLCNYHLKTLMLWTCEEKSTEWWNLPSVIEICCKLLQKLSEWLKKKHCPNYFIPEANLFHEHMSPIMIAKVEKRLNEFCNSDILCIWFEKNYILPITRKYFRFSKSSNEVPHFLDCMLYLLERQDPSEAISFDWLFSLRFHHSTSNFRHIIQHGYRIGLSSVDILYIIKEESLSAVQRVNLPKRESVLSLKYYNATLYILLTANGLGSGKFSWNSMLFVDFVVAISLQTKIVGSHYHNFPKQSSSEHSQSHFVQVQDFMENLTGSNSRSEFQLLSLMTKEYLHLVLQSNDSQSSNIATAALVYLASLHFVAAEYQTTTDLCSRVFRSQSSQQEDETLNAGCLFFIDDVVRIVGFWLLYRKIKENEKFTSRPCYLDLRAKPEVFAHYLTVLSAEKISKHLDADHDFTASGFPFDKYLMVLTKRKFRMSMKASIPFSTPRKCVYRRTDSLTENETFFAEPFQTKDKIIDLLMEYALENMTSFYSAIHKDFGIQCNIVQCYRALYLYRCRQYTEVLNLCEQILHEPDLQSNLQELAFANVLVLPPLDSYFDEDVQSLLGFHTLFSYFSPANDKLMKLELTNESTFEHCFAQLVYKVKNVLSAPLKCSYSTKSYYFLGRHFLARYLKLRCCIDYNQPYTDKIVEFASMKRNFPFEHIIHRFLLRKLRKIQK